MLKMCQSTRNLYWQRSEQRLRGQGPCFLQPRPPQVGAKLLEAAAVHSPSCRGDIGMTVSYRYALEISCNE